MSDRFESNSLSNPTETTGSTDKAGLNILLHTALSETLDELDAVGGAVYFIEEDGKALGITILGGTPPAIFIMKDRVGLDSPDATAQAFKESRVVLHNMTDKENLGHFAFSVASGPIVSQGRRFGVMTVLCNPSTDAVLQPGQAERLQARCARLADDLVPLSDQGIAMVPSKRPILVPMDEPRSGRARRATYWGLPGIPDSIGITQMYQVRRLSEALNQALRMEDVTAAAQKHIMLPFNSHEIGITVVDRARLWMVGHGGQLSETVRMINGSSLNEKAPIPETYDGPPLFVGDRETRKVLYPNVPEPRSGSWAYLPLGGKNRRIGVLCLSFKEERIFTPDEQAVLMMMADMLGAAMERIRMNESERSLSQTLQKTLLPRALAEFSDVTIATRYLPAGPSFGSGGDWYDVLRLPDGRIGFVVGDVEGHGAESAVVMGQARTAILSYAREGYEPSEIMERAGKLLNVLSTELLATCCIVCLDVSSGMSEICLAGHPPPVVREPNGDVHSLEAPVGVPLGLKDAGDVYRTSTVKLERGSLLLLYTNGIASGNCPDALTDAHLLLTSLREESFQNIEKDADEIVTSLTDSAGRQDDVVMLLVNYEGARQGLRGRTDRMEIQQRDLQGVKAARNFVRSSLDSWGLDEMSDQLELIVSELATNALIHADSDVELRLREYEDRVRMEVRDSDTSPPVPKFVYTSVEDNEEAESGRGLLIVDALSSAFGSSPNGRGKTVWLEVPTPEDSSDLGATLGTL